MTTQERAAKVLQEIDEQLALAEKATPGPWTRPGWKDCVDTNEGEEMVCVNHTSNAAFIAASRTGWPTALRCLKTAIGAILDGVEVYGASSSWDLQLRRLCDQWDASRK